MNATISPSKNLFRCETKDILLRTDLPADNQDPWQSGYEFGVWHLTASDRARMIEQMDKAARLEREVPMFSSFEVRIRPEVEFIPLVLKKLFRAPWFDDESEHQVLDSNAVNLHEYAKESNANKGYDDAWVTISPDRIVFGFGVGGLSRRVWTEEISRDFLEGIEFNQTSAA